MKLKLYIIFQGASTEEGTPRYEDASSMALSRSVVHTIWRNHVLSRSWERDRITLKLHPFGRGCGVFKSQMLQRFFLWRACSNILPTKDNLVKRGFIKEDLCIFCSLEKETILHILWECPSSQDVWGVCEKNIQKSSLGFSSFMEVVNTMMVRCKKRIWGCLQ